MIAEMMGSAPAVKKHPDVIVATEPAPLAVGEVYGGEAAVMEDLPSEDEDQRLIGVGSSSSGSRINATGTTTDDPISTRASASSISDEERGSKEGIASGALSAADSNAIDAFAVEHKIPISHQVRMIPVSVIVFCFITT
jgi:hypothetical protein